MDKRDEEREEVRSETVEDDELRVRVESQTVVVDEVVQALSMAMGVSKGAEMIGLTAATLVVVAAVAAGVMAVELET